MKRKLNIAFTAVLSCFIGTNVYAQSLVIKGTSTPFLSAFICTESQNDNPEVTLSANINPAITSQTAITLEIQEINVSGQVISATSLNANQTTLTTKSSVTWDIEIGNAGITTRFTDQNNNPVARTVNFNRKDATYRFRITHINESTGAVLQQLSFPFTLAEGVAPRVKITKAGDQVSWATSAERYQILAGCNSAPVLRIDPSNCSNDAFWLSISEYDFTTHTHIGTAVARQLSSTEISQMISTSGMSINGFTSGGNTINFTIGKRYAVYLTYNGQGTFRTTFAYMYFKQGTVDLIMKDYPDDSGFEPSDIYRDLYSSKDLWNKLSTTLSPTTSVHEDPTFVQNPNPPTGPPHSNKMMVMVTNIGCVTSPANTPLNMYWTRARADELWDDHWVFSTANAYPDPITPSINRPAGAGITISGGTSTPTYTSTPAPYLLPALTAGQSFQIPFNTGTSPGGVDWYPPYPGWYNITSGSMTGLGEPVICLLARINEPNSVIDPIIYEPTGNTDRIEPYVSNNNNVVTRNTKLVTQSGFLVLNPGGWNHGFGTVAVDNDLPTTTTVTLCVDLLPEAGIPGTFYNHGTIEIGTTSGLYNAWQLSGAQLTNAAVVSPTLFVMTNGTSACLDNITLPPHSHEQIGLRFNYLTANLPTTPLQFSYRLRGSYGTESPVYGSSSIFIADVPTEIPNPPSGEKPANIEIVDYNNGIRVYPNPSNDYINININRDNTQGLISVYDVAGHLVRKLIVNEGNTDVHINISDLIPGNYTLIFEDNQSKQSAATFVKR